MKVRGLKIRNFRGVEALDWCPSSSLVCIVGPGDVGKSTVLEAIGLVLSPRWVQFDDSDFPGCDTSKRIEITVTVGELPEAALQESRMGLHLRGWTAEGKLRDEPADDDEPVLSVRLTVDSSLEPVWELITDRSEPRALFGKDRALFGAVRLAGEAERHLTWAHNSALTRLTGKSEKAPALLAGAYRTARELIAGGDLPELTRTAKDVHEAAVGLGAYAPSDYAAGLDTQRSSTNLGTLALHGSGIPVRLAGIGTRRLVSLAIQRLAIPEGAIILVDELEHGLEPHRIRHVLKVLREAAAADGGGSVGQVILTTHSEITVVELAATQLAVAASKAGVVDLRSPTEALQPIVRRVPEAFLARRVIVCEGKTEVGLLRALRSLWRTRNGGVPVEHRGVVLVDGGGAEAPATAGEIARLGYATALLRDSDVALSAEAEAQLKALSLPLFEWPDACSTEERVLRDVSDAAVQRILEIAYDERGFESVQDAVRGKLGTNEGLPRQFTEWRVPGRTRSNLRQAIAEVAMKGWFKRIDSGEQLGAIVAEEISGGLDAPLASVLRGIETWAYG